MSADSVNWIHKIVPLSSTFTSYPLYPIQVYSQQQPIQASALIYFYLSESPTAARLEANIYTSDRTQGWGLSPLQSHVSWELL